MTLIGPGYRNTPHGVQVQGREGAPTLVLGPCLCGGTRG